MREANDESICMPSRSEIETLCVLHAVGSSGCRTGELAARLGLSATLAEVVAEGMEGLVIVGLLERVDGRFTVTDRGRETLTRRLAELDLA